jgi:NAD+ kinase
VQRLALVLRPDRDLHHAVQEICVWSAATGVELVGADGEPRLPDHVTRRPVASLAADCDAVLALGGDGTVLGALRLGAPHGAAVLGVNLGTLGYLTEVDAAHLGGALAALAQGDYRVETRTGLALGAVSGIEAQIVYNDVVVTRVPGRGQAALGLRVDGELLVRYASDGVIAATPQGSTAYAFAAGGPLVSPRAQGMIVCPMPRTACSTAPSSSPRANASASRSCPPARLSRSSATVNSSDTPTQGQRSRSSRTPTPHA